MMWLLSIIKSNPFIFGTVILYFLGGGWYFMNKQFAFGWTFILYGLANVAILSAGVK